MLKQIVVAFLSAQASAYVISAAPLRPTSRVAALSMSQGLVPPEPPVSAAFAADASAERSAPPVAARAKVTPPAPSGLFCRDNQHDG